MKTFSLSIFKNNKKLIFEKILKLALVGFEPTTLGL